MSFAGWEAPLTARALWWRWSVATFVGEIVGFGLVGLIAFYVASNLGESNEGLAFALIVAAGALEGVALGTAQGYVLQRAIPRMDASRFVLATALAAVLAWLVGMAFGALASDGRVSTAIMPWAAFGLLVLLGGIMGAFQWNVLRHHLPRAWRWIPASAIAWSIGLLPVFGLVSLIDTATPTWLVAVIVTTGGLLMGACVGVVTGWALVRLVSARPIDA